ncbi:GTPase [Candidatus Endoriftia persephone]|jgi:GTPase SAR1 family protein|uniref:G domain-containing protein n=2 Tax=Gammaproteobacteria TaxID=1236 RepID=G2DA78_9GAMM|nr:GTPase [Candidatus Endoriftia persephone]EGV52479.1 hypothetical protein Rifp1Sym_ah00190 [endosymbiont of Riftia pachyptila (vent Ph05)]USF86970.1 50S ribosome-binding GTPase [Candidatus Endoriftia persephone]
MSDTFQQQFQALREWTDSARQSGWIPAQAQQQLAQIEQQQADDLFTNSRERPLIVAFFGGTGVGKSSLLNRLAQQQIARVGVQRPTSQEVTLYLHQDFPLAQLPAELPLEETVTAYHQNDRRRLVAWLDLPDIDSIEQRHRALVEAWLPYVDWMVYVVSPDRYHDDLGWRFLQQRGQHHAWLFVINHWDQGAPQQLDDFRRRLQREGFSDPAILRTSCTVTAGEDDFPQLEATINRAIETYGLELFKRLGLQAREAELQAFAGQMRQQLSRHDLAQIQAGFLAISQQRLEQLTQEMALSAEALIRPLQSAEQQERFWRLDSAPAPIPPDPAAWQSVIWSQHNEQRFADLLLELENHAVLHQLPVRPLKRHLKRLHAEHQPLLLGPIERAATEALARPGRAGQRLLYRGFRLLSGLLPLAAAAWAGYHVVADFYAGTRGEQAFLGLDFAIHTTLLVLLAWLIPQLLQQRTKPSAAASLRRAIGQTLRQGIVAIQARFTTLYGELDEEQQALIAALDAIISERGEQPGQAPPYIQAGEPLD